MRKTGPTAVSWLSATLAAQVVLSLVDAIGAATTFSLSSALCIAGAPMGTVPA